MCGVNTCVCVSLLPVPLGTWCLRSAAQCRISYLTGDTATSDSEPGWMQDARASAERYTYTNTEHHSPHPLPFNTITSCWTSRPKLSPTVLSEITQIFNIKTILLFTRTDDGRNYRQSFHLFLTLNSLSQESEMYRYVIHVPAGDLWSRTLTDTFAQTEHALLSFKESLPMAHWRLLKCHDANTLIFVWGFLMFTGSPLWGGEQVSI